MNITLHFHFAFDNNRIRGIRGGNLKGIFCEGGINQKQEEYVLNENYDISQEVLFQSKILKKLEGHIRKSPSVKQCIFKCELVPNRQVTLGVKFNRKLTSKHAEKIAEEVCQRARRRFQNPDAFI